MSPAVPEIIEFVGKLLLDLIRAHRRGDARRVEEILGPELHTVIAKRMADEKAAEKFG